MADTSGSRAESFSDEHNERLSARDAKFLLDFLAVSHPVVVEEQNTHPHSASTGENNSSHEGTRVSIA